MRSKLDDAALLVRGTDEAERAALNERLIAREQKVRELQEALEKTTGEAERLNEELRRESDRRSAAERSNERIPLLDAKIDELQRELAALLGLQVGVADEDRAAEVILLNDRRELLEGLARDRAADGTHARAAEPARC